MICLTVLQLRHMGKGYLPHGYCEYASRVLMIFLTGTEDSLYSPIDDYAKDGGPGEV